MTIELSDIGKRFQYDWIFKDINYTFSASNHYALLGNNGSGKSTLLRIISGLQSATKGKVEWNQQGHKISHEKIYKEISYLAPAMELVEEMTLMEFLHFHFSLKNIDFLSINKIPVLIGLKNAKDKYIRDFSSGMKQRVKLAQAFFTTSPILLLDEPCSNLDKEGIDLYQKLINDFTKDKLVIIASNDEVEYYSANDVINIKDYQN